MRLLVLVDSDSQIFGTLPLAEAFARAGHEVRYVIDRADSIADEVVARVAGRFAVVTGSFEDLAGGPDLMAEDALLVFSTGSRIHAVRAHVEALARTGGRRPLLLTGFNGVVFEKFEEGLAWRAGYDLIAIGGPRDRVAATDFLTGSGLAADALVETGIGHGGRPPAVETPPARPRLVFAEQVIVPASVPDRIWLTGQFNRLALDNPGWDIVLRPRAPADRRSFHKAHAPLERMIRAVRHRAPNLAIDHTPLPQLLAGARLFCTVSSTALFEALRAGVPSFVIGDFGIANSLGTHVFAGSGLMRRLSTITRLQDMAPPVPRQDWLAWIGYDGGTPDDLVEAAEARLAAGPGPLPPTVYGLDQTSLMPTRPLAASVRRAAGLLAATDPSESRRLEALAERLEHDPAPDRTLLRRARSHILRLAGRLGPGR